MLSFEVLECMFAHSSYIAVRLSLSNVCKYFREYIDAHWTELVAPGEMQTAYTLCKPVNIKVFVLTYNGFIQNKDDDYYSVNQWTLSFQRRDKKWHRMYKLGGLRDVSDEYSRIQIDGLKSADLFGGDDEAHVLVHILRKGDSRCAVLLDKVIPNVIPEGKATLKFADYCEEYLTVQINHNLELFFFYCEDHVESDRNMDESWLESPHVNKSLCNKELPCAIVAGLHGILDA